VHSNDVVVASTSCCRVGRVAIGGSSKGGGIVVDTVDEGSIGAFFLGGLLAVAGFGLVRTLRAGDWVAVLFKKATDPVKLNCREKLFDRLCGMADDLLDVVDCDQRF